MGARDFFDSRGRKCVDEKIHSVVWHGTMNINSILLIISLDNFDRIFEQLSFKHFIEFNNKYFVKILSVLPSGYGKNKQIIDKWELKSTKEKKY